MRNPFLPLLLLVFIFSCKNNETNNETSNKLPPIAQPEWIMQGNIYEVNVRQYTSEGTFNAFAKHLDRLKEMGVQTVWFMPINPISKKDRKGTLGSYYAVSDYIAINPEYGTMNDWKELVQAIHAKGMKVMIDWVPNHTGADNRWITSHPDFYVKDSTGKPAVAFNWDDVRQLDYKNTEMQDSMIAAMKFWITDTGIDGFRVDVAWNISSEFWNKCIPQLKELNKNIFMLAEGDKPYLMTCGFNAFYPWEMFHKMIQVAAGERPALALDSVKNKYDTIFPSNAIPLYFTSNHDENSWNKSDYGAFPGAVHAPFAVFTQTMAGTVPLIYSGQEEPILRALPFFEKDTIVFSKFERAGFYKKLLELRKKDPALAADASFMNIENDEDAEIYSYIRQSGTSKVLVILNFSNKQLECMLDTNIIEGEALNIFSDKKENIKNGQTFILQPWGYVVYEYFPSTKK